MTGQQAARAVPTPEATSTIGAEAEGYIVTRRVTIWGLVLNLFLSAGKILVGFFGQSQALLADGFHSLSDTFTDVAVLVGLEFWSQPPDDDHPYGHGRIETIVAVLIGLLLGLVGAFLMWRAVTTMTEKHDSPPEIMCFYAALVSIIGKEWLFRWTDRAGRQIRSMALRANAWHHRSDALSSIPVAVAVIISRQFPAWAFIDHVAAVLVAMFIVQAAWKIVRPGLAELTDAGATGDQLKRIEEIVRNVPGVMTVHAIRTRFHGSGLQVDLHVHVAGEMTVRDGHEIAHIVKSTLLRQDLEIQDVLVHIEPCHDAHVSTATSG